MCRTPPSFLFLRLCIPDSFFLPPLLRLLLVSHLFIMWHVAHLESSSVFTLRNWSNNCLQSTSLSSRSILGIKTSNMYWDWFPSHRQKDEEAQNSEMQKSSYLCLFVAVYCVFRQHLTIMCVFTQAVATLGPHRGRSDSESSAFPFRPDRSRPILNCWDTHTSSRIGKNTSRTSNTETSTWHMVAFRSAVIKTHTAGHFSVFTESSALLSWQWFHLSVRWLVKLPLLPTIMTLIDKQEQKHYWSPLVCLGIAALFHTQAL